MYNIAFTATNVALRS